MVSSESNGPPAQVSRSSSLPLWVARSLTVPHNLTRAPTGAHFIRRQRASGSRSACREETNPDARAADGCLTLSWIKADAGLWVASADASAYMSPSGDASPTLGSHGGSVTSPPGGSR